MKIKNFDEFVNENEDDALDSIASKEVSTEVMKYLKANYNDWQKGYDNEDEANGLFADLMSTFPNEDEKSLKAIAYLWVGYSDLEENKK